MTRKLINRLTLSFLLLCIMECTPRSEENRDCEENEQYEETISYCSEDSECYICPYSTIGCITKENDKYCVPPPGGWEFLIYPLAHSICKKLTGCSCIAPHTDPDNPRCGLNPDSEIGTECFNKLDACGEHLETFYNLLSDMDEDVDKEGKELYPEPITACGIGGRSLYYDAEYVTAEQIGETLIGMEINRCCKFIPGLEEYVVDTPENVTAPVR